MILYSYWRSTTSYRVRIALNLKGLDYEVRPVDLVAGAQRAESFLKINPSGGVPALVLEDGTVLTQSMAILDYLEAIAPEPALLPDDPVQRAQIMAAAHVIALDIHPVNNLKVVGRIKSAHGASQDEGIAWMQHWMTEGFRAYQALLPKGDHRYSFGDTLSLADLCLVGQMVNARRWGVDLTEFERLVAIDAEALELEAVRNAAPEAQVDAG